MRLHPMKPWISFEARLPTRNDADQNGNVLLLESNNSTREGMWDWIPPSHPRAVDTWYANGFAAWRRLRDGWVD